MNLGRPWSGSCTIVRMASKKRSSRSSSRSKVFHVALFLNDGRIVEANAEASSAEAAASILTSAAARFLSSSYDALRRGTEDALSRNGATPGLPYVTLNKNSPAPHVSVVQTGVVADARKPRRSSRRPAARHGNAGKPGWASGRRPST